MKPFTALLLALGVATSAGQRLEASSSEFPSLSAHVANGARTRSEPAWFKVDHKAKTVTMDVVSTQEGGSWKFNGYSHGKATITVPAGYKVTINFTNEDFMAHSIGVSALPPKDEWPSMLQETPVFAGAITPDATSISDSTKESESDTITFEASKAGNYALVCFVPGHAPAGMWIRFNVAAGTEAGVQAEA